MIGAYKELLLPDVWINQYKKLPAPELQKLQLRFRLRTLSAIALGISLGTGLKLGFFVNSYIPMTTLGAGAAFAYVTFARFVQRRLQLAKYRRSGQHLIQP